MRTQAFDGRSATSCDSTKLRLPRLSRFRHQPEFTCASRGDAGYYGCRLHFCPSFEGDFAWQPSNLMQMTWTTTL